MAQFSSMQFYAPAQQAQQLSYMAQQNSRIQAEATRTIYTSGVLPNREGARENFDLMPMGGAMPMGGQSLLAQIPDAKKCIGQVVLDWEFIHDLDLHLLKVQEPGRCRTSCYPTEPNPEPTPEPSVDINALLVTDASGQRLRSDVPLQSIVSYRSKVHNPSGGQTPEAVLEVDRNAAVHSLQPVENLYLTETLQPGAYVVGVHNYTLRQLANNVIGPSTSHKYRTFEDFKKMDPGYQKMEKALHEQSAHAGDPDGTTEKQEIMARVDAEMNAGSQMIQSKCTSGASNSGVHYGITLYNYLAQSDADAKHPQAASFEELPSLFQSGFFATADFVFDPNANTTGYNGATVVADVNSEQGKLALAEKMAAHVAILKIITDAASGKSKISEVIMLDGRPRANLGEQGFGISPMNAFRTQMMQQNSASVFANRQVQEPFPEPQVRQMPMQMPRTQMQQPLSMPAMQIQQPLSVPSLQQMMSVQQHFPEASMQQVPARMPMSMSQPFPEPSVQQMLR